MKCKMNYSSDTDIGENVLLTGAELRRDERAERDICGVGWDAPLP